MITTMSLLEMSLYGGIFIAAITVLRAVAFSRLPKSAMKILWGAAFFRLMIPVTVTSPVSIYSAAGKIIHTARRSGVLPSGYTPAFLGNHAPVFSGNAGQLQGGESLGGSLPVSTWASPAASWISPWILIWAAVAIAAAVCFWISHRKGMKIYRESLPLSDPLIENWMEGHRLRRKCLCGSVTGLILL